MINEKYGNINLLPVNFGTPMKLKKKKNTLGGKRRSFQHGKPQTLDLYTCISFQHLIFRVRRKSNFCCSKIHKYDFIYTTIHFFFLCVFVCTSIPSIWTTIMTLSLQVYSSFFTMIMCIYSDKSETHPGS